MNENPIVEEIHRIRQEMLAEYGGDLHALVVAAQQEAARSGRRVVMPTPRGLEGSAPVQEDESKIAG